VANCRAQYVYCDEPSTRSKHPEKLSLAKTGGCPASMAHLGEKAPSPRMVTKNNGIGDDGTGPGSRGMPLFRTLDKQLAREIRRDEAWGKQTTALQCYSVLDCHFDPTGHASFPVCRTGFAVCWRGFSPLCEWGYTSERN
jgi:hypothetical protein